MSYKEIGLILFVIPLSSCTLVNGIKEFGNASISADYFLKNYTDFYDVDGVPYVRVGLASDNMIKDEYISAINGKFGFSYRFYTIKDYPNKDLLLVNSYNKLRNKDYLEVYANKNVKTIPISYLNNFVGYDSEAKTSNTIKFNDINYAYYGIACQPLEYGEVISIIDGSKIYEINNYSMWIMKLDSTDTECLYYNIDSIKEVDVDIVWAVRDIVVHD